MKTRRQSKTIRGRGGFTLIEVIVAMGIFATVAVSIVALLALGSESVGDNSGRSAAYRLVGALEERLGKRGFDAVYEALRDGSETDFFLYSYAGHATENREDGSAVPEAAAAGDESYGYRREAGFREGGDALLEEDLEAALGAVFRVRLSPLPAGVGEDVIGYTLPDPGSYGHPALRLYARLYLEPSAEVAGQRPLTSLPEVLSIPLLVDR